MDDLDDYLNDICRVCRCEGSSDKPLYHPCICTGSIKFIHQDCLVQWLRYSEKDYCELCNHKFSFIPIYSPDMPNHLPLKDIFGAMIKCIGTATRYFFQYIMVLIAWLGIIPLTSYRVYIFLFNLSFDDISSFSFDFYKSDNFLMDIFYGSCVVMSTLCIFIFLLWLREQILRVGTPNWIENPQYNKLILRLFRITRPPVVEQQANAQEGEAVPPADNVAPQNVAGLGEVPHDIDNDQEVIWFDEREDVPAEIDEDLVEVNNNENEAQNNVANDAAAVAPFNEAQADNPVAIAQDWNPVIDWERGPENLTWKKIIGLDGTFAFLENVFWLITLNTLSMLIFAYFPFHTGQFLLRRFHINSLVSPQFDRFICILIGYISINLILLFAHFIVSILSLTRIQKLVGLSYIIVKVALLIVLEIVFFPLLVGWCLDICSIPLFGITIENRIDSFFSLPASSVFIHWLAGMICVFYFLSFLFLVKEVVRPGLLWFVRDYNDPNFNPVSEMIHLPYYDHFRRCVNALAACVIIIGFMVYLPICFIQLVTPDFLNTTYTTISNKSIFSYLSVFDFMVMISMFKAIFPGFPVNEPNNQAQDCAKRIIKGWFRLISYILDLKSFLLANIENTNEDEEHDEEPENLANNVVNYQKPNNFRLRVIIFGFLFAFTIFMFGLFCLTIPIFIGYLVLCGLKDNVLEIPINFFSTIYFGFLAIIELYYLRLGRVFQFIYQSINSLTVRAFLCRAVELCKILANLLLLTFFLAIVPLLIGTLFDFIVLMPIRVPLNQTPILYIVQDWVIGCFLLNVICPIIMMTNLRIRRRLEMLQDIDILNVNVRIFLLQLALPSISVLGLIILVPFLMCSTLLPLIGVTEERRSFIYRRIHLFLSILVMAVLMVRYHIKKITSLYEHIRNDKYLVGKRLVNYDSNGKRISSTNTTVSSSSN